ncbi:MAG: glycoside hydrolase family 43 protein [Lachnospiraceae bacterium]|nr:glycoside hydrolase family 43 protein [Lachnospiraceae bacterium]
MKKKTGIILSISALAVISAGIGIFLGRDHFLPEQVPTDFTVSYDNIKKADILAGVSVHDPSVIKADNTYYIFGSHMAGAASTDLRHWKSVGNGYSDRNPIFNHLLSAEHVFDYAGSKNSIIPTDDGGIHVWAPDVIYNKAQGLYYMYFCTTSTWNASNLCYAASENPEGPYTWKGALIYSGFTGNTIGSTDVLDYVSRSYANENYISSSGKYNYVLYPNAIDPSVFYDKDGRMWMVYGSWSGGIFLLEIDEATGLVIHPQADPGNHVDPYFGKRLLGGGHKSIEGPYILYDEASDYYYLFVSYGSLVREGGYQIRVFRSKTVDGNYVDMNGKQPVLGMDHSPYGLKLSGNYYLPGLTKAYMATGHNSAFTDNDGKTYIVFHTRFDNGQEYHEPRVHQYIANEEGWPCMLPYATDGETVSENGCSKKEIAGEYYVINQGTAINADIAEPVMLTLSRRGNVYGDGISGTWKIKDGTCYMHIILNNMEYSGIFCQMNDEAGTPVMVFSAVGSNQSLWGVKYTNQNNH